MNVVTFAGPPLVIWEAFKVAERDAFGSGGYRGAGHWPDIHLDDTVRHCIFPFLDVLDLLFSTSGFGCQSPPTQLFHPHLKESNFARLTIISGDIECRKCNVARSIQGEFTEAYY